MVALVALVLTAVVVWACLPREDRPRPTGVRTTSATFEAVVDGDTVRTDAGTVRIIGIDTPERGECGYDAAADALRALLAPGDEIELRLPDGENDQDRYGRLIRSVISTGGVDVALHQIEQGLAVARYDSTDGYPEHPAQGAYHDAQRATLDADGAVVTVACATVAAER